MLSYRFKVSIYILNAHLAISENRIGVLNRIFIRNIDCQIFLLNDMNG